MSVQTAVVLNDLQIPFQDTKATELVLGFVDTLKPDVVVLNGDIVDCFAISTFDRSPLSADGLDLEIRTARKHMTRLAKAAKECHWVGGNHEDRLRRHLWKHRDSYKALGRIATQKIVDTLMFPALFETAAHGFQYHEYGEHVMLGKLKVTHGFMVRSASGATARAHFDRTGSSIMIGHTHRLGAFYRTNDHGPHGAWENGCLCRLDPEWVKNPDWQTGFSVVHVGEGGWFSVQQVPILKRGKKHEFFYGKERVSS